MVILSFGSWPHGLVSSTNAEPGKEEPYVLILFFIKTFLKLSPCQLRRLMMILIVLSITFKFSANLFFMVLVEVESPELQTQDSGASPSPSEGGGWFWVGLYM